MTRHASSAPPQTAAEPSHAERARTLLDRERIGTLATNSQHHPGYPFASVMPYALGAHGAPLFLISSMAIHTQNLVADARASLLVMQSGGDSDPLGLQRVTLIGNARRLIDVSEAQRAAYLEQHPSSKQWISFSDFSFFELEVRQVYCVGGFGVMGWVEAGAYAGAAADPLAGASAGIIEHMNRDHADAVRNITRRFGGLDAEEAQMVAVDRLGFVVRAKTAEGMKGTRIAFPEEVRSSEDARRVLVAMARHSRPG
jgi:putative heme iron utilization protein